MIETLSSQPWIEGSMSNVPNIVFNLTYLGVTTLAKARLAPPKTQVKTALG